MRAPLRRDARPFEFFNAFVGTEDRLRREVFFLAYHLHWSHTEAMTLPIGDRWDYIRLLVEQLDRERSEVEQARGE